MFKLYRLFLLALAALFVLTACGGGGGGGAPLPSPTPTACTDIFDPSCTGKEPQIQRTQAIDTCVANPSSCPPSLPDEVLPCLGDLFGNACDNAATAREVEAILQRTDIPARRTPELATSLDVLRSEVVQTCTDNPNKRQNGSPCVVEIVNTCVSNPFNPQCTTTQSAWVPQVWDYARVYYCTSTDMFYSDCLDDSYGGESERQTFCRSNLSDGNCTITISRFCDSPAQPNDIFDGLCNTGYNTERREQCLDDSHARRRLDSSCEGAQGILALYCRDGQERTETRCPNYQPPVVATCVSNPFVASGCNDGHRETFCRSSKTTPTKTNDCTATINRLCDANPFDAPLCSAPDDAKAIAFCQDASKTPPMKTENCSRATSRLCGANPFGALCGVGTATYRAERITACNNNTVPAPLNRNTVCTTSALMAAVCGANDAPFNFVICGADDGVNNLANRQTFCRSNLSDNNCTQTISRFCGDNANDIFDGLCNTGYDTERGMACANTANPAAALDLDTRCGSEDSGLLATYCTTASNTAAARIHCPQRIRGLALNACTNNRFGVACDRPEDLVGRIAACKISITTNGVGGCAATAMTVCKDGYNDGTNDIAANPFDSDLCGVGTATYRAERITACNNDNVPAPLNRNTVCTTSALMAAVCGANDAPFNFVICGADDGVNNLDNRQTFCRSNLSDGNCTQTIARFCGDNANDIFDGLCNTGYDNERGMACANTANSAAALDLDTRCGDENSGLLATYCTTASNTAPARIHCPQRIRHLALDACTNNRFGPACDRPEDLVGRIAACKVGGTLPEGVLESACTTNELQGAVCVATGTHAAPFDARICGADDGTNFVDVRQTFCRSNLSDGNCTQTISRFCGDNANDIFDGLCNTGYDGERRTACANTANPAAALDLDTRCGSEDSGLLATYCTTASNTAPARIHCPQRVRRLALDACTNNRFGVACDRPEDLVERISACRVDLNANGSGGCDETVITVCERGYNDGTNDIAANPFDSAFCFDGTTYLAQRITACKVGGTLPAGVVASTACITAELRDEVCVATGANADPLDTRICGADDGTILVTERQTFCRDNLTDSRCTQTIARFCDVPAQPNDIFDTLCDEFGGINDKRAIACIDDLDTHEDCADILAALIGPDPAGPILPSGGDEITAENWILALGERDVAEPPLGDPAVRDENDLNKFVQDSGGLSPLVANFEIITLEGLSSLEGVAAGGVAIKSWNGDAVQTRSADQFAGILPATTVGAPITRTEGKAAWHGYMKIPERNFYRDFILDVDFETQKLEAIVDSLHFVHQYIYLTADFDDEGIISGRADYAHDFFGRRVQPPENKDSSVVSGIIGQGGAVAVFIGKQGYDGETGGFAATPVPFVDSSSVDFSDWIADFGYTPPPDLIGDADNLPKAGFQTTSVGRLDTEGLSEITGNTMTIKTADTANNDSNLLADRSGVAYHRGKIDGTDKVISTAGVLDGTDLGAPLVGTPLGGDNIAIWKGHVEVLRGELFLGEPFDFIVDFNRRDIAAVPVLTQFHNLFVSGYWDNRGVLNGEVGLFSSFNGSIDTRARASLKGLIGQGGLVGAFASHAEYPDLETIIGGIIAGPTGAELSQNLCTHTPFAKYCDDEASVAFRIDACRNGTNGSYTCHHTIIAVCDEDPFDAFCYEGRYEDQYAPLRADACRFGTSGDNDCAPVVVVTCGSNPFDLLCYDDDTYVNARIEACRNDMHGGDDCAEEKPIICGPNPFNIVCTDEEYFLVRIEHCRNGTNGENRCEDTIEEVCAANPFDTFCDYSYLVRQVRRAACVANAEADPSCGRILTPPVGVRPAPDAADRVTIVDWLRSFDEPLATEADGYNPRDQYLIATEDGLNAGTLIEAGLEQTEYSNLYNTTYERSYTLTLASETLAGESLGGDASSGISFFSAYVIRDESGRFTNYYGVLPNTDLGARLTSDYGRAEWSGIFQASTHRRNDFTLIVNFDSAGKGKISANFGAAPDTFNYTLTGSFDDNGVITGRMIREATVRGRGSGASHAVRGLIGSEGAIGILESPGPSYSIGGFVARSNDLPAVQRTFTAETITPGRVTTADWLGSFDAPPPSRPTGLGGHFLQATAKGLNLGHTQYSSGQDDRGSGDSPRRLLKVLTMADHTFDGVSLGGQKTDGVAFFRGWLNSRYNFYAGILSGTDLGAPLTQSSGDARWNGRFQTQARDRITQETNFVLEVDFHGTAHGASFGTIEATFVPVRTDSVLGQFEFFHLKGQFDNHGVITGTIDVEHTNGLSESGRVKTVSGYNTGILTGLIGAEGAVGAFYAVNLGINRARSLSQDYSGGFVASPNAIIPAAPAPAVHLDADVTFDDWVDSFDTAPPSVPILDTPSGFLQGTATGLSTGDLINEYENEIPYVHVMTLANSTFGGEYLGGDAADGVAFFEHKSYPSKGYAGVLSNTNLGAPVTQTSGSAVWNGRVQWLGVGLSRDDLFDKDFNLEVTFGGTDVAGSVEAFVQHSGARHLYLKGDFDSNGVIDGQIQLTNFPDYQDSDYQPTFQQGFFAHDPGTLSGLIGQEGAVGVFFDRLTVGGFVACPPAGCPAK